MEYQVLRSRLPPCKIALGLPANLKDSFLNCTRLLHLRLTSAPELQESPRKSDLWSSWWRNLVSFAAPLQLLLCLCRLSQFRV